MILKGNKYSKGNLISNSALITDTSAENNTVPQLKKKSKKPVLKVLLLVQFIIIILAGYFLYQYLQGKSSQPTTVSGLNGQTSAVKEAVGKLIKLDPNTEPTIATLKDVDALKKENNEFYKDAKNGDILLIYPARAILYSIEDNIIVNVAPIINNNETQISSTPVPASVTPTTKVSPTPKK